ncbi:N-terminal peptidyl-methionine acetyltransferase [Aureococcus anophagefferens]|uniref:N-terminal peptidyl-methionine acetyltransferase n=1 Tax=Aureococcus anophagefferens TaxID=44056 RepID=A0ABR1GDY3_AURAN
MTTTRAFRCEDLFRFNNINLDALTETYNVSFYYMYMSTWPDYFKVEEHPSGKLMGYIMGKAEGEGTLWHGHVTAVTVAPEFQRRGLGRNLAISMYTRFGYSVYRRVIGYYSGTEDAFDMREGAARDREKRWSIVPLEHPIYPDDLEW